MNVSEEKKPVTEVLLTYFREREMASRHAQTSENPLWNASFAGEEAAYAQAFQYAKILFEMRKGETI